MRGRTSTPVYSSRTKQPDADTATHVVTSVTDQSHLISAALRAWLVTKSKHLYLTCCTHRYMYKLGGRLTERQAVNLVLQPFLSALLYLHSQVCVPTCLGCFLSVDCTAVYSVPKLRWS
jgi:hypothetical protein